MNEKGIDMDIPDNLEEEDFLIIYKGRKSIEDSNEEEIVEIKTSKDDFIRKFRYFKKKVNELEHKNEIFIHDRFCTVTFKNAVDSLRSKKVEVCKDNCMELLSLSKKYEYDEMASTINKFIDERPDLDEIITSLLKTDKDKQNEYRESDGDSEDSEDSEESENIDETEQKKEELIAAHLDFFLERGALRNMSTFRLFRILNSPHRVVNNHHMLFEFIKNEQNTRKNSRNRQDNKYLDMLTGTLDYSEMSIDEIEYIVQSEYYTPIFEPRHRENAIKNLIDHIKHDEEKMNELDLKIKTLEKVLQTHIENIENNELKHRQNEAEQAQQIAKLEDCIKESIDKITQQIHLIEQNNLKYQNEKEEKMKIFKENNNNDIKNIKQNIDKIKINIHDIESKSVNEHEKNQQLLSEKNLLHKKNIEELVQKIEKINKVNKREHEEFKQKQLNIDASYQNKIKELRKRVETIEESNKSNTNQTKSIVAQQKNKKITAEIGKLSNGLLSRLKRCEDSPFNHLFIASQSSNDIYNLIDPNTSDKFCLIGVGGYVEIELQEPVNIIGIKIFSSTSLYPKSFDIEIDDKLVKNVDNANELSGKNRSMTVSIDTMKSKKMRIINRGSCWDNDNKKNINIKRIEILSNEEKYSRGVFSSLLYQSEDHDPHKCPVFLSASFFDLNTFTSIDPPSNICTYDEENSWFQIEFTQGSVVLHGFRLKRSSEDKMRSYKIICTDDANKPEEKWTTLIEINEKKNDEHELLDVYQFHKPSPPSKYVRLIQTGPNWNNNLYLEFGHFDLFGDYLNA